MASGYHVGAQSSGRLVKGIEFYLPVAKHVRIRGASCGIFIEHVVHNPLAIFLGKIYEIEGDSDLAGNQLGHESVLLPLAVAMKCGIRIVPVLHEHSEHVVALPL